MAASLQPLLDRRLKSVAYLRDVFAGETHFLSVARLSTNSQAEQEGVEEHQVRRWFYLGVSLATVLPQQAGAPFVRAVLQIIEELQHCFASSAERSIKSIRARVPTRGNDGEGSGSSDLTPSLQRQNGKVLYEYLLTPHVAHGLSGLHVALSLCELLHKVYVKLGACLSAAEGGGGASGQTSASFAAMVEAVSRVDEKLEEHCLVPATKHAELLAKGTLRQSLCKVDPIFGRLWAPSGAPPADFGGGAPADAGFDGDRSIDL